MVCGCITGEMMFVRRYKRIRFIDPSLGEDLMI